MGALKPYALCTEHLSSSQNQGCLGRPSLANKNFEAQKRKETELVFSRMFTGLAFELTQLKPWRVSRALRCGGDCAQDANGHTIYSVSAGQGCPDEGLMGGFQLWSCHFSRKPVYEAWSNCALKEGHSASQQYNTIFWRSERVFGQKKLGAPLRRPGTLVQRCHVTLRREPRDASYSRPPAFLPLGCHVTLDRRVERA